MFFVKMVIYIKTLPGNNLGYQLWEGGKIEHVKE